LFGHQKIKENGVSEKAKENFSANPLTDRASPFLRFTLFTLLFKSKAQGGRKPPSAERVAKDNSSSVKKLALSYRKRLKPNGQLQILFFIQTSHQTFI
jgi:hypothetical protein